MWEHLDDDCDREAGKCREWCEQQHRENYCVTAPKEPWVV
jgi:hypothetical protein